MNRHDTDAVSLTFGSIFMGIVMVWLLARIVTIDLPSFGWLVAGALILLGAAGLVATTLSAKR